MGKYTIDRFEGDFAVLLDRANEEKQVLVLKEQLPPTVREGDILELSWQGNTDKIEEVTVLQEETKSAKEKAEDLLQKLLDKNK